MVDGVFAIIAAIVLGSAGAVSLKLSAMMTFGDTVKSSHAFVVSAIASLASVLSLTLIGMRQAESSVAVFIPGLVFAGSSWVLVVLVVPFTRTEGWRTYSKAFLITMAQCIGVTVVGTAVCSIFIVGAWMVAAVI